SSDSKDFTIGKAATTTTVTCPANVMFTGSPIELCSARATGVNGLDVPAGVTYSNNTMPGTATANGSFTGSANYAPSTGSATFVIDGWTARGFHQPVGIGNSVHLPNGGVIAPDSKTVWNTAKGGATIPLKFNLFAGSAELKDTKDIKGFSATALTSCSAVVAGSDEVDITTTGNTALRYDTTEGQFIQNWKTPTVKAGEACYRATVTFQDGSTLSAFFKLRK
ncbi:PxKF domain-containing protein, partial [Egicoccus sp. AB-alg6-2]|uniref:PxKF domain-containing protein n=1 Tax=Egicoccus sp. AB-alg6-2 TaxID=3242692 RepID=UPI00359D3F2E